MDYKVNVIGCGLAGAEATYQLSKRGISVDVYEMKPTKFSPAHTSSDFAEIVCSNSFKSEDISTASGCLKAEMNIFGSLILDCAKEVKVPAGTALAVDRELFSKLVTQKINEIDKMVDAVIEVVAPTEIRIKRIQKRNGLNRNEIINRINSQQFNVEEPHARIFTIENDGNSAIIPQLLSILANLGY